MALQEGIAHGVKPARGLSKIARPELQHTLRSSHLAHAVSTVVAKPVKVAVQAAKATAVVAKDAAVEAKYVAKDTGVVTADAASKTKGTVARRVKKTPKLSAAAKHPAVPAKEARKQEALVRQAAKERQAKVKGARTGLKVAVRQTIPAVVRAANDPSNYMT